MVQRKGEKLDLYWGWYVVLGAFLIMAINYGARYCFGVFVKPMSLEYHWSRSVISLGASVMVLSYGIGGIFSGYLLDRMVPRQIITIGAIISATGLILTGFVQSPWQFYLTYGVLCGGGTSCFGVVVCNASVGKWFIKKRGIALGTASVGVGVGTLYLVPPAWLYSAGELAHRVYFSGRYDPGRRDRPCSGIYEKDPPRGLWPLA